jgi:hypothetical protein
MIKRKINLFTLPKSRLKRTHERLRYVKGISIVLVCLLFILIFSNYLYQAKLTGDITTVQGERDSYTNLIQKETPRQQELNAILSRLRVIRQAFKKDIQLSSSSAKFNQALALHTVSAKLDTITFSSKNVFKATLSFPSQTDLLEFIRMSENPEFKSNFDIFSVGAFKISNSTSSAELKTIEVSGTLL